MNDFILGLPLPARIVGALLVALSLSFLVFYVVPGIVQRFRLGRVVRRLRALKPGNLAEYAKAFSKDKRLTHLWNEYKDTLHAQKELNTKTGSYDITRYRATVPAEVIFTRETLADTVIASEFFRHIPGIFTGLGIIGTFIGLIRGIKGFTVSENSQIVRDGLNALLHDVGDAFSVSFVAIALAMLVTLVEKIQISGLYAKIEELCQVIDASFESGAGEEYLARLVKSSESAEKETKILKDALVTELKQVLETLADRQIEQAALNAGTMADRIVAGMNEGLREPLTNIGNAVKSVGANQNEAVNNLILDTMSAMTAKIQEIFGGQIEGINRLQQETIAALQGSLAHLDEVTAKMARAGESATDRMAAKLEDAIVAMEARQRLIDDELVGAVSTIRATVADSQAETNRKTQEAVAAMSASVTELARNLQSVVDNASARDQARAEALTQHATRTQEALSSNLDRTLTQVAEASQAMQQAVQRMGEVTNDALRQMNEGANTLYIAASAFAKAGAKTSETLEKAGTLSGLLSAASSALTGSSNTLTTAVAEYKTVRDEVMRLVTELRSTVESAKTEASLTTDVLARIRAATENLMSAEKQAEEYLERVSEVLVDAHSEFSKNITNTLRDANSDFHLHLTNATKMLGDTVEGLSDVLERIPTRH
jgi:hypothetical protein